MESDWKIVEATKKQCRTCPPVQLQDFEVQYVGGRPVHEYVTLPPYEAPVHMAPLQSSWDNPDHLYLW